MWNIFEIKVSCNNFCFKINYEIRLASEQKKAPEVFEEGDITYSITYGDYSPLMGLVANSLEEAIKYAANCPEKQMLQSYVSSFRTGSLDDHKNGITIFLLHLVELFFHFKLFRF